MARSPELFAGDYRLAELYDGSGRTTEGAAVRRAHGWASAQPDL